MLLKAKNGLSFYQFPNLAEFDGIQHAVFSRHGGRSQAPFQSLNVSLSVGDNRDDVIQNRRLILESSTANELVFSKQLHGVKVLALTNIRTSGVTADMSKPLEGDALVTDIEGKGLVIQVADCQSILIYDPQRHVAANLHCGWRGSIHNIIGHTIQTMVATFGCDPGNIHAGIGPSLGPCCAEFVNYKTEIPTTFWKYRANDTHFDFWSISREQLGAAGIPLDNIYCSDICTKCNLDRFFSFRGEGTTGRFAAVITLQPHEAVPVRQG